MKKFLIIASCSIALIAAGCAGVAAAESIKGVSEIVASNAIQKKSITVTQLSTLAGDLAKLPNTPLPSADNAVIANLVTEAVAHKQANLTDASVVDALNGVLTDLTAGKAPTVADGVAWANLQDAVMGFQKAAALAAQNPSLAPSS